MLKSLDTMRFIVGRFTSLLELSFCLASYHPSFINFLEKIVQTNFLTSQEILKLLDYTRWDEIKGVICLMYNKGKYLAYVWDSTKLSEVEEKSRITMIKRISTRKFHF